MPSVRRTRAPGYNEVSRRLAGGWPNWRLNARLNAASESYPTRNPISAMPSSIVRTRSAAICRRHCARYRIGGRRRSRRGSGDRRAGDKSSRRLVRSEASGSGDGPGRLCACRDDVRLRAQAHRHGRRHVGDDRIGRAGWRIQTVRAGAPTVMTVSVRSTRTISSVPQTAVPEAKMPRC